MFRYYTRDSQAILLEFIINEIDNWPTGALIPLDIYFKLSNPEVLATQSIEDLCHLFKSVIEQKCKTENS